MAYYMRFIFICILISLLLPISSFAGSFGYDYPYKYDSTIAPVNIESQGIYNLVISVHIMNRPYDKKVYKSDEYNSLLNRFKTEWRSVAINTVLERKVSKIEDLLPLKQNIESELAKLVEKLKKIHPTKGEAEVIVSIANFYLLDSKK